MRVFKVVSIFILSVFLGLGIIGGCGGNGGGNNPPPGACQMPPLNTDFSDTGYGFVDVVNAIGVAITSTGNEVVMVLTDIPDSGTQLAAFATPVSANQCNIFEGQVINEGQAVDVVASGTCLRLNNGGTLEVNDLVAGGIALGVDIRGDCEVQAPLDIQSLNEAVLNEMETTRVTEGIEGQGIIADFVNELNQSAD